MSEVKTKLVWSGNYRFRTSNETGHETTIDGDSVAGPGPLEMMLDALGACSASDVINILTQMRQPVSRLEVNLHAQRHSEPPRYLTSASLRFDLWGDSLDPQKVERAINLSLKKYCSVYHSIRRDLGLQAEFRVNSEPATEGAYQTVGLG